MTDIFYKANLKCPICDGVLMLEDQKTLYCNGQKRHAYDLSSSGYVNLSSPKQCGGGDTKEAVRARSAFLDAGYYKPISDKTLELLTLYGNGGERVVDAGCGEGYYTVQAAKNGFFISLFKFSAKPDLIFTYFKFPFIEVFKHARVPFKAKFEAI